MRRTGKSMSIVMNLDRRPFQRNNECLKENTKRENSQIGSMRKNLASSWFLTSLCFLVQHPRRPHNTRGAMRSKQNVLSNRRHEIHLAERHSTRPSVRPPRNTTNNLLEYAKNEAESGREQSGGTRHDPIMLWLCYCTR